MSFGSAAGLDGQAAIFRSGRILRYAKGLRKIFHTSFPHRLPSLTRASQTGRGALLKPPPESARGRDGRARYLHMGSVEVAGDGAVAGVELEGDVDVAEPDRHTQ